MLQVNDHPSGGGATYVMQIDTQNTKQKKEKKRKKYRYKLYILLVKYAYSNLRHISESSKSPKLVFRFSSSLLPPSFTYEKAPKLVGGRHSARRCVSFHTFLQYFIEKGGFSPFKFKSSLGLQDSFHVIIEYNINAHQMFQQINSKGFSNSQSCVISNA